MTGWLSRPDVAPEMKSQVIKRSIVIDGAKTSVSIEDQFWQSLKEIARDTGQPVSAVVSRIKATRAENSNLSSAIRVHVLGYLRARVATLLDETSLPGTPDGRVSPAATQATRVA